MKVWSALGTVLTALLTSHVSRLTAQDLAAERKEYANWLSTAPLSPYAAIALQPVGSGLVLGPASGDIPLSGFPTARVLEDRGAVFLEQSGGRRALPRNRPVPAGNYRLFATGTPGRTQLLVYGSPARVRPPAFYPALPGLSLEVSLQPSDRRGVFRTLGSDGLETEATEAGFIAISVGGATTRLRVYRMGGPDEDEAELQVFFRDSTNGQGTYPAGRFVTLDPVGNGRYRLDFNRARNPFCAYNTVFPCPPPWPGNSVTGAVKAGEKYEEKP